MDAEDRKSVADLQDRILHLEREIRTRMDQIDRRVTDAQQNAERAAGYVQQLRTERTEAQKQARQDVDAVVIEIRKDSDRQYSELTARLDKHRAILVGEDLAESDGLVEKVRDMAVENERKWAKVINLLIGLGLLFSSDIILRVLSAFGIVKGLGGH